jgi:REP element-mobilizing transposase RayT
MPRPKRQQALAFRTHGGRRPGAGRKPAGLTPGVSHRRRPIHDRRHPVHVTIRCVSGLPSLRAGAVCLAIRHGLAAGSRADFRIVHYTVQTNHVHLLIEADGTRTLGRGMQGLAIRLAKTINRQLGRSGRVWSDRYHCRALQTPREVRNGLIYVLLNGRKHRVSGRGIDPCSSGSWFRGWRQRIEVPSGPAPVAWPTTWLLSVSWRRGGPIDFDAAPARYMRRRCSARRRLEIRRY